MKPPCSKRRIIELKFGGRRGVAAVGYRARPYWRGRALVSLVQGSAIAFEADDDDYEPEKEDGPDMDH